MKPVAHPIPIRWLVRMPWRWNAWTWLLLVSLIPPAYLLSCPVMFCCSQWLPEPHPNAAPWISLLFNLYFWPAELCWQHSPVLQTIYGWIFDVFGVKR